MDRYVGLDAHASSCTLAVVGPSGKRAADRWQVVSIVRMPWIRTDASMLNPPEPCRDSMPWASASSSRPWRWK